MNCTIFRNIFDKKAYPISVDAALERIRDGKSKDAIEVIRAQLSKDRADKLKANLPSVCFSGIFEERKDEKLIKHSGFIVLDFDNLDDLRETQTEIISKDFVYACWVSPRGNGLKALVKIADGTKHREHFQALQEVFTEIDRSGINVSRVCFESYDSEIYINKNANVFKKTKSVEVVTEKQHVEQNEVFSKLLVWLSNRGDSFVKGERNFFVFKLASACCRFGISQEDAHRLIRNELNFSSNTFSDTEAERTIKSAYRANNAKFGTAILEKEILVERTSRKEVEIDPSIYDDNVKPKDVIYGEDVKAGAMNIYDNGYEKVFGINVPDIDKHFKLKSGEITLLTGIGNYGKSNFIAWFILMRCIIYDEKYAFYSPENEPAEEFYHDFVEIILGVNCTPDNPNRPSRVMYEYAYDFVSNHIFFVYPKDVLPTPDYLKERFLELVIKEKISGVICDPYNQIAHDYKSSGGRSDKYLEFNLSDFSRFAKVNSLFFIIIAHPKLMVKKQDGNYPCPDVFDVADGAMWNNKMDNILVYDRPVFQTQPDNPLADFHAKKIRRQKVVGKRGFVGIEFDRRRRRYIINGCDPMGVELNKRGLDFYVEILDTSFNVKYFDTSNYHNDNPF